MEEPFRKLGPRALRGVEIIETLGYAPGTGPARVERHLDRMQCSARALGFRFDRAAARARLAGVSGPAPLRLRLTLAADGGLALTTTPLGPAPRRWRIALSETRLDAADPWLRHKTTRRALYDRVRMEMPEGVDEVVFANRDGALCEGTITSLFVERDGRLLTPPLSAGLLPGVLRAELIEQGRAVEAPLTPGDLSGPLFVGNALRGLIPAELLRSPAGAALSPSCRA
ncbi:aminotransferase class IV family protein [Acidimangrovimonas pyrenivorans]|uniref:Probable branched-chain-amino-acid aminotransferase n=1 Tax=Acidimangrovimonas pyrenivorans TaxID=2030798 RepID=A0ABV7AJ14_9RHOB